MEHKVEHPASAGEKKTEPVIEEPKLSYQHPQPKDICKYSNIGIPTKDKPLLNCCLMDLSVAERKKYMWHVPKELHCHEMYCIEPENCEDLCAKNEKEKEKEKKQKKDQEDIIKQQAEQIQALIAHTKALTEAVNSIIQGKAK